MARKGKTRRAKQKAKHRKRQSLRWQVSRAEVVAGQAADLINRGRVGQARDLLEEYDSKQPGQTVVLRALADVYNELREHGRYCRVAQRLLDKDPDDADSHVMLAGGYLATMRPVCSYRMFQEFLRRWPDHPFAEAAGDQVARMEPAIRELLDASPFPETERLELTAMHEQVMDALSHDDCPRVIKIAEALIQRQPDFLPAKNNVTEAYFRTGQSDKAIAICRSVLDTDPENTHAASNLTRLLFLSGQFEEAEAQAKRLQAISPADGDACCKVAEALSYLGDNEGMLAAFRQAEKTGDIRDASPSSALLYHLAAVAHARLDDWKTAKRYWKQALKVSPSLDVAQENLTDSQQPRGQRHGPWAYGINYWFPKKAIDRFAEAAEKCKQRDDDQAAARVIRQAAEENREILDLIPAMLDRSGPVAREFAMKLAKIVGTPEMISALRDFCLSDRGPDKMRSEATGYLRGQGELPAGTLRMFFGGQWQDTEMFGFEVTDEPTTEYLHTPQVDEWGYEAIEALKRNDGKRAERLLHQALEVEPDQPDLLNNLAMAYMVQGREEETEELLLEVHRRWPDYFFGRIAMANHCTKQKKYDQAAEYLAPLRQQTRLHSTECSALFMAYIRLFAAQGNFDAAQSWMKMWKDIQPGHPGQAQLEPRISLTSAFGKLLSNRFRGS